MSALRERLMRVWLLVLLTVTAVAAQAKAPSFRFDKKGRFRIMQLTDLHYTGNDGRSDHLPALLGRLIEAEHPDLIILTGDVVYGKRNPKATDADLWREVAAVLARHKVPYAVTLGNHDAERTPRPEVYAMVRELPGCINAALNPADERQGDFVIPVLAADGSAVAARIYVLDSNDYNADHSYAGVSPEQVVWYRERSAAAAGPDGSKANAVMFFHIPLQEFREAYDAGGRISGFRLERECPGRDNAGLFDALVECGEVSGLFAGHDHSNNYVVMRDGVALGYGRYSGGYGEYQELLSGCRMVELQEGRRGFRTWERLSNNRVEREIVVPDFFGGSTAAVRTAPVPAAVAVPASVASASVTSAPSTALTAANQYALTAANQDTKTLVQIKQSMRQKIVAGNWKMNTLPAEGVELAKGVAAGKADVCSCVNFVVCPPFTHLSEVVKTLEGSGIAVGAQNCAAEAKGAFTGEVAASMIAALGCKYVILGHSERRQYYGETSETLNKKMEQAYANNLIPIYCVGENLDEREAGKHFEVVKAQIEEVVYNLTAEQFAKLVIAYEPVWAIGTGKTATADQAQEIHAYIREVLAAKFGAAAADTAILYGGSCKPSNAAEIFAKEDVDGGLIGGAALKAEDFLAIGKGFPA